MKRQTFDIFQFNPKTDAVVDLQDEDLKALVSILVDRQIGSVLAHHIKKMLQTLDDRDELTGMAIELVDSLPDQKPFYVFRFGDIVEEADELTLEQLFGRAVAMGVAANLGLSTMTIGGQRTPVKPPTTTYKHIDSTTRPGHVHTVELLGGVPVKCSCEGFFHRKDCKHLKMALRG